MGRVGHSRSMVGKIADIAPIEGVKHILYIKCISIYIYIINIEIYIYIYIYVYI